MTYISAATAAPPPPTFTSRRSFLQLAGAGLAAGAIVPFGASEAFSDRSSGTSRAPAQVVRRFVKVVETRDSAAIWSMFTDDGVFEFPQIDLRVTDLESFESTVGFALSLLDGLTFTDLTIAPLADPNAVIAKYRGHATVSFTGKPFEQIYIAEAHVRRGRIASWSEYYDTAAFNESFTP